jgi:hypothetical protein
LIADIIGLIFFGFEFGSQKIGEKENLQDHEHDEEFDQDDRPQRLAKLHVPEALIIKTNNGKQDFFHTFLIHS